MGAANRSSIQEIVQKLNYKLQDGNSNEPR